MLTHGAIGIFPACFSQQHRAAALEIAQTQLKGRRGSVNSPSRYPANAKTNSRLGRIICAMLGLSLFGTAVCHAQTVLVGCIYIANVDEPAGRLQGVMLLSKVFAVHSDSPLVPTDLQLDWQTYAFARLKELGLNVVPGVTEPNCEAFGNRPAAEEWLNDQVSEFGGQSTLVIRSKWDPSGN
jgi:hypothetical protein